MDDAIEPFLSSYTPQVRDLFARARQIVLQAAPEALEQVDAPSRLAAYGLGPRMADMIFTLMPLKEGLNIGVYRGTEIPDPSGLLIGTGKVHRHVRISRADELESPALRALLEAAVSAARERKGERKA